MEHFPSLEHETSLSKVLSIVLVSPFGFVMVTFVLIIVVQSNFLSISKIVVVSVPLQSFFQHDWPSSPANNFSCQ